ncbi:MAG: hypothetical protein ACM3ML_27185 [Micromonosporaceae bacterium]
MKLNRKRVLTGLAAAGVAAGVLAGGGVALAATGTTPTPAAATTSASVPCGMGYGYGHGQFGGMHAQAGQQTVLSAAAGYLGLTQAELRTQLQAGKSFADVAKAEGKSVSGLKDAILAAVTSRVNANTRLTAEQKATILAQVKSNLDTIVTAAHPAGAGLGPMWARR